MPVPHLSGQWRRAIAVTAALACAAAGLTLTWTATGTAASSPRLVSASVSAPLVVRDVVVETAARAGEEIDAAIRAAHTLVVFGDSISARFNDVTGDVDQAFWSMVADEVSADPEVRAEGGAGFVNPGLVGCTGSTLNEQLTTPEMTETLARAGAVIVEGGRTDTQTCRRGGGYDLVPQRQLRGAVESFMSEVVQLRGEGDPCTVVVVPWGPKGMVDNKERITLLVKRAAKRHGFTFVDTMGLLTDANTMEDRVHPTLEGNRLLTQTILDRSELRACFA